MEEINVYLEATGTHWEYREYHNDIFINGEKCGTADYDKRQGVLIGGVEFRGKKSKNFYRKTTEGIARAVKEWAEKILKETPERQRI